MEMINKKFVSEDFSIFPEFLGRTFNVIHVSHNDMDGYGCTILIKKYLDALDKVMYKYSGWHFVNSTNFSNIKVGEESVLRKLQEIAEGDQIEDPNTVIIITDLNITEKIAQYLGTFPRKIAQKFVWIDHHEIDFDLMKYEEKFKFYIDFDSNHKLYTGINASFENVKISATQLVFDALKEFWVQWIWRNKDLKGTQNIGHYHMEWFAVIVSLYDTYEFYKFKGYKTEYTAKAIDEAYRLNVLFGFIPRQMFMDYVWDYFNSPNSLGVICNLTYGYSIHMQDGKTEWVDKIVSTLVDKEKKIIDSYIRYEKFTLCYLDYEGKEYKVAVVNCPNDVSWSRLGNRINEAFPEVDFTLIAGTSTINMYSNKDGIDLSAIARKFGGGGHTGAAGMTVPRHKMVNLTINQVRAVIETLPTTGEDIVLTPIKR